MERTFYKWSFRDRISQPANVLRIGAIKHSKESSMFPSKPKVKIHHKFPTKHKPIIIIHKIHHNHSTYNNKLINYAYIKTRLKRKIQDYLNSLLQQVRLGTKDIVKNIQEIST